MFRCFLLKCCINTTKYMFEIQKYLEIKEKIADSGKLTKIIAISKNHPKTKVDEAISYGLKDFGENRVQEAKLKFQDIKKEEKNIKLHLTGPLQTNKVKQALEIFDIFHTLDREKLLREFSKFPDKINEKEFFVQVNTGKEISKSGVYPEDLKKFIEQCGFYGIKNILGLMCIPPINEDPKKHFSLLRNLSLDLGLGGLSMGMSSDYESAIDFNPSYIRLGTILFGNR